MAKEMRARPRGAVQGRSVRRARRRSSTRLLVIAGAAALVLILAGLWFSGALQAAPRTQVQTFPIQSRDHIAVGAAHPPYNSDPPTGGWHYAEPAAPGVYDQPLPDEQVVHNLEHGYIVIAYDCSKLADCNAVKTQLRAIFDKYNGWKLVIVPRSNRDANDAVALTAWGRLAHLPSFDQRQIESFIADYRDKGPEQTPD